MDYVNALEGFVGYESPLKKIREGYNNTMSSVNKFYGVVQDIYNSVMRGLEGALDNNMYMGDKKSALKKKKASKIRTTRKSNKTVTANGRIRKKRSGSRR